MKRKKTDTQLFGHAPRIFLSLTPKIIEEGTQRNSNHCMVAEALRAKYPELTHIAVDIQTIRATDKKKRERYVWLTPRVVQQMIVDFDRGQKIQPFGFHCRDGQVTATKAVRNGNPKAVAKRAKHRKLRMRLKGNNHTIPERVGGAVPPRAIGQRREYGLRSFDRLR
jgi:hypothetical protein